MTDSHDTVLIGVDGGGTGCRAAVARMDLKILGQAEGGRANIATDIDRAIQNVVDTIGNAARNAGIDGAALTAATAHVGLAGVTTDAEKVRIAAALPCRHCTVTDDRPTAVTGALGEFDGFVLAIGTGTICASKRDGAIRCVGGYGFYVSDQGSGAWLGRGLLDRALQCHDGVLPHSPLTRDIMTRFHGDPFEIVAFSMAAKPGDYATFAPDIITAAKDDDKVARALIGEGATYLNAALAALGFDKGDRLCLTGGVGRHYAPFLPDRLTANTVGPAGTALDGALRLAAQQTEGVT